MFWLWRCSSLWLLSCFNPWQLRKELCAVGEDQDLPVDKDKTVWWSLAYPHLHSLAICFHIMSRQRNLPQMNFIFCDSKRVWILLSWCFPVFSFQKWLKFCSYCVLSADWWGDCFSSKCKKNWRGLLITFRMHSIQSITSSNKGHTTADGRTWNLLIFGKCTSIQTNKYTHYVQITMPPSFGQAYSKFA